ncbi:hypothetical protein OROGR_032364 [Orobanche gracilis]
MNGFAQQAYSMDNSTKMSEEVMNGFDPDMVAVYKRGVVGVPVTLNEYLKNQFVEFNVGFDTICKKVAQANGGSSHEQAILMYHILLR